MYSDSSKHIFQEKRKKSIYHITYKKKSACTPSIKGSILEKEGKNVMYDNILFRVQKKKEKEKSFSLRVVTQTEFGVFHTFLDILQQ